VFAHVTFVIFHCGICRPIGGRDPANGARPWGRRAHRRLIPAMLGAMTVQSRPRDCVAGLSSLTRGDDRGVEVGQAAVVPLVAPCNIARAERRSRVYGFLAQ